MPARSLDDLPHPHPRGRLTSCPARERRPARFHHHFRQPSGAFPPTAHWLPPRPWLPGSIAPDAIVLVSSGATHLDLSHAGRRGPAPKAPLCPAPFRCLAPAAAAGGLCPGQAANTTHERPLGTVPLSPVLSRLPPPRRRLCGHPLGHQCCSPGGHCIPSGRHQAAIRPTGTPHRLPPPCAHLAAPPPATPPHGPTQARHARCALGGAARLLAASPVSSNPIPWMRSCNSSLIRMGSSKSSLKRGTVEANPQQAG